MDIVAENRDRIRDKAKEMFLHYGLRSVSMDDLAGALGISKKTIYQNYKDKDEIVDEVVKGIIQDNVCLCEQQSKNSRNAVEEMMELAEFLFDTAKKVNGSLMFELMKYHPKTYDFITLHKREYMPRIVEENLLRGIEEGIYRSEIDVKILSLFRSESVFALFDPEYINNLGMNLREVQAEVFWHFMHGIVNEKGLRILKKYKNQPSQ